MTFRIIAINHVCLVVRNRAAAERFYVGLLGLCRHHRMPTWLILSAESTLHLVEIPEAADDESLFHLVQHFALQVSSLRAVLKLLFEGGLKPFQMDFSGDQREIADAAASLDFGLGTVFVYDPDGNLVEFLEEGVGIFTRDMRPQLAAL